MNALSVYRPRTILLSIAAVLPLVMSGTLSAATREETISVVDMDKLQWKDYPGLPGVTFTVVDGDIYTGHYPATDQRCRASRSRSLTETPASRGFTRSGRSLLRTP